MPLQPSNSKVDPLNLVDAVLNVGKTPNLHFLALPYLIHDHLYDINIYECLCRDFTLVYPPIYLSLVLWNVLLHLVVVVLV